MKKIIIIVVSIIIVGIIGFVTWAYFHFKADKNKILDYMVAHPDQTAFVLQKNDSIIASHNPNQISPLASTVKWVIAINFAQQVSQGKINPDTTISIQNLDLYYIPETDGGAHEEWLKTIDSNRQDKITLKEVLKGMMLYSSNANTEWLTDYLGLDAINQTIKDLGAAQHEPLYYLSSSLFVPQELFANKPMDQRKELLEQVPNDIYWNTINHIHTQLKTNPKYKNNYQLLDLDIQKVWSDRFVRASALDYIKIMKQMNNMSFLDATGQKIIDEIFSDFVNSKGNNQWIQRAGMKGGSTASVLTKALFLTDKKGNQYELVYYINNTDLKDNIRLQISMNEFELNLLTQEEFRNKVIATFK